MLADLLLRVKVMLRFDSRDVSGGAAHEISFL
jgi:hypothetical protein